jgi:hypothetical protein
MTRDDFSELHYITAFDNVVSILERGILSHEAIRRLPHRSVASAEVQARRASRKIPQGLRLHQYANLYFNGRNAMLYKIINDYDASKRVPAEELTLLRVSTAVLDIPGVVVTDINGAADVAPRWFTVDEGIAVLEHSVVFAQYWDSYEHKQRMMAEALVPHRVSTRFIEGAYAVSDAAAMNLSGVAPTLDVEVNAYMFFRGPRP